MFLKAFTQQYDLQLLPAAHSGIRLGNLVWKPFWGHPKLSHPGLPNHISNALYDVGLLDKAQWSDYLKSFDVKMCRRAKLARIKIQGATEWPQHCLRAWALALSKGTSLKPKYQRSAPKS